MVGDHAGVLFNASRCYRRLRHLDSIPPMLVCRSAFLFLSRPHLSLTPQIGHSAHQSRVFLCTARSQRGFFGYRPRKKYRPNSPATSGSPPVPPVPHFFPLGVLLQSISFSPPHNTPIAPMMECYTCSMLQIACVRRMTESLSPLPSVGY